jgi:hypothetical protein
MAMSRLAKARPSGTGDRSGCGDSPLARDRKRTLLPKDGNVGRGNAKASHEFGMDGLKGPTFV